MNFKVITTMVILASAAARIQARVAAEREVTVCMDSSDNSLAPGAVGMARRIASRMFSGIGVKIVWRGAHDCPAQGIVISLSYGTPITLLPGALATAMPYEGTHIRVFYDRVVGTRYRKLVPILLAHVFAHEITHILEGISRHSPSGIMKAQWSAGDYSDMLTRPFGFGSDDIDLIYSGLARRTARLHTYANEPSTLAMLAGR